MPNCKKCKETFPNTIVIDNRRRVLSSRKYCLICSPFGLHNTSKLEKINKKKEKLQTKEYKLRDCRLCFRQFAYKKNSGHSTRSCNSCLVKKRRRTIKEKAIKYKGGSCQICNYNKSSRVLSFHHIKSEEKYASISKLYNHSWNTVKKELDKCILLCANCHAEMHDTL